MSESEPITEEWLFNVGFTKRQFDDVEYWNKGPAVVSKSMFSKSNWIAYGVGVYLETRRDVMILCELHRVPLENEKEAQCHDPTR